MKCTSPCSLEPFLDQIRVHLEATAASLVPLFEVMAGEARFARAWLADDLAALPTGATLLEVGGGVFLLSCSLVREGFSVTAIEPIGDGFGEFEQLGAVVLEFARREGVVPTIAACKAEYFRSTTPFDFAFSLNVMEHIDAPEVAIERVSAVLKVGAFYRFMCPNYLFPYEPHFNIPIVLTKQLTERCFGKRIFTDTRMQDAAGVWRSLNWLTVPQVKRIAATDPTLTVQFNRASLVWMLERAVKDRAFAARRSGWMVGLIRRVVFLRLHRLAAWIPPCAQPIMDVRLTKGR